MIHSCNARRHLWPGIVVHLVTILLILGEGRGGRLDRVGNLARDCFGSWLGREGLGGRKDVSPARRRLWLVEEKIGVVVLLRIEDLCLRSIQLLMGGEYHP